MTSEKATSDAASPGMPPLPAIPGFAEPLLAAMGSLGGSGVEAASKINKAFFECGCEAVEEMAAFANRRLGREIEAAGTFREWASPADLLKEQTRFNQRLTRDCAEEARKLGGIFSQHADEMWEPWQTYNRAFVAAASQAFRAK